VTCAECGAEPGRTFCSHGIANLDALRSVGVSPVVFGRPYRKGTHDRTPMNSWERGIAASTRPDGSKMPYLDDKGQPIGVYEWGNTWRRKFEAEGLA
jgi:hypothetical protein